MHTAYLSIYTYIHIYLTSFLSSICFHLLWMEYILRDHLLRRNYSSGLHFFIWCAVVLHSWWSTSWESVTVTYINISVNVLTVTWSLEGWLMTKVILMYMKWSEMKAAQSCATLCNSMDCSLPGSSVHGILQARILEWVAIPFSRESSKPRDQTQVSCTAGSFFTSWATREAQYMKGIRPSWVYFRNARFISHEGLSIICWHIKRGKRWLYI